jgi:large subunit ribosomal protein L21e
MRRKGSPRMRTRHKLHKNYKDKGKISLTRYLAEYKPGDKVLLKAEPAVQKGMYYVRYHGKVGVVEAKQGDCYKVIVMDRKAKKTFMVHPIHLRKVE